MERPGPLKEHLPLGVDPGDQVLYLKGAEESRLTQHTASGE